MVSSSQKHHVRNLYAFHFVVTAQLSYHPEAKTWLEARNTCNGENGHLAEVFEEADNEAALQFVRNITGNASGVFWIGAYDANNSVCIL